MDIGLSHPFRKGTYERLKILALSVHLIVFIFCQVIACELINGVLVFLFSS